MTEQLEVYASHLNASEEVKSWLSTTGKKALKTETTTISELEHVLDFLVSSAAPSRLQKMSLADAKRKALEWSKQSQKKGSKLVDVDGDVEVIHDFLDGTKVVKLLTKKAYQREGFLMSHCVGGYDPKNTSVYSYRDAKNDPHATFEVKRSGGEILQVKGKGNGPIHPKYIHPILAFLKSIEMVVRSSEMRNLGYYHVDKSHVEFLRQVDGAEKQFTMINGEAYVF